MPDRGSMDAAAIVSRLLGLESARLLAMATILRSSRPDPGSLREVDRALEEAMKELRERGVSYPGHVLGRRYDLSGPEYAVLQLALMPHHAPDDFAAFASLLGSEEGVPRLSHALTVLAPVEERETLREVLIEGALVGDRLVRLTSAEDPALLVHDAVLELFGLS